MLSSIYVASKRKSKALRTLSGYQLKHYELQIKMHFGVLAVRKFLNIEKIVIKKTILNCYSQQISMLHCGKVNLCPNMATMECIHKHVDFQWCTVFLQTLHC